MKKTILIFIVFIITIKSTAQANDSEALLYNIGVSGVFATIGSIINKDPSEKINKVIVKGLAQGALGGFVTFGSKCLLRENERQQNFNFSWPAKIVNAAGTSIIENAAMNKDFYEKWHINLGFNRVEFETKSKFKVNYKIMPVALVFITDAFFRYDKFELETSLKTGEFIFTNKNLYETKDFRTEGATLAGYFVLRSNSSQDQSISTHETIHIYQSNTYSVLNTYFQKPLNNWASKNKTISLLNNYVYFDLHYLPLKYLYVSQRNPSNYYANFFEHEAGYFSNTLN